MSLAVGCGGSDDESHSASDTGATAASGFALYEQHCADCHGADAEGTEICLSLVTPHINEQSDSKLFIMIGSGTAVECRPLERSHVRRRNHPRYRLSSLYPNRR